ncbi:MAG: peptidase M15 [Bacteroidales bacterium]
MRLSEHFTLEEFTRSAKAQELHLSNEPGEEAIGNLRRLVTCVLEPVRQKIDRPIRINSGYRSKAVNEAVGGVETSQHRKGMAADIVAEGMPARELFEAVQQTAAEWDQVILYPAFVHVSYRHGNNRKQALYAKGTK